MPVAPVAPVFYGPASCPLPPGFVSVLPFLSGFGPGMAVALLVLATAFGWGNAASIAVAVVLAFFFGYLLTYLSVRSMRIAFASDTVSIATMEIVDNAFILLVPGAMAAGLGDALFWWSLLVGLAIAFVVTVPVNAWLIGRGRGHAAVHAHHRRH